MSPSMPMQNDFYDTQIQFLSGRESTISFNDLSDERTQATENEDSLRWPRFIGIGDGDFEAEDGWVSVEDSASVVNIICKNIPTP